LSSTYSHCPSLVCLSFPFYGWHNFFFLSYHLKHNFFSLVPMIISLLGIKPSYISSR
jgi:hypothetical protein